MSPPSTVLELCGICKAFPGVRAVDGVDLDLRRGEVHALVGENGAGKSTLMNILAGVLQPDAGEIRLEGRPTVFPDPSAARAAGVALVFQEGSSVPSLSVAENVYFNRQPTNGWGMVARRRLWEETAVLLAQFEAGFGPGTPVRDLSPAARQIVEIAKAISSRPKVLVLDEPTSSLGAADVERLFRNVARWRAAGTSVIYISHHLREVFALADRVTVLRDGRKVGTFAARDVTEDGLVRRMVGRELRNLYGTPSASAGPAVFTLARAASRGRPAVDLSLRAGEIVGLAGLIGSGRTTLAKQALGLLPNATVSMTVAGRPVRIRHPREAAAHGLAYLTEDRKDLGLFLDMSIRDNFAAPTLARHANRFGLLSDRALRSAGVAAKTRYGIAAASVDKRVRQLSGGNQQKVLLGMWMEVRPKVFIVDEPTRGVDVGAKSEIYALLRQLAARGVAVLLISSELGEILGLSDRVLVMRKGALVAEIPRGEATEERVILAATGVEPAETGRERTP